MGWTPFPHGVTSMGIPQLGADEIPTTTRGTYYFLNNAHANTSDGNNGLDMDHPLATLAYAVGLCSDGVGDVIIVGEGHSEESATAIDFTTSKDGIRVVGLGSGRNRPLFTVTGDVDLVDLNGANIELRNLRFTTDGVADPTAMITVGGADNSIRFCEFICNAKALDTIAIEATADRLLIEYCKFEITADGPNEALDIEGACDDLIVRHCIFNGLSDAAGWDAAAILSGSAHLCCFVYNNLFLFGMGIDFNGAATGIIANNFFAEGTLAGMLDPGSCMCFENYEADAVDEYARVCPGTKAT